MHDEVVTELVGYIRMEQCETEWDNDHEMSRPRPGLKVLAKESLVWTVSLNCVVPYGIEYKEAQQGQDDEDQYTDIHKASDRDSRRRVDGVI